MAEIKITPQLLDRLRGLAQNCQPPIWKLNEHSDVVSVAHTVAEVAYDEDAQFIAAADPATVLAMVEEIEQLRRMERKWGQMLKNVKDTAPDLETFFSPDAFKIKQSEAPQ